MRVGVQVRYSGESFAIDLLLLFMLFVFLYITEVWPIIFHLIFLCDITFLYWVILLSYPIDVLSILSYCIIFQIMFSCPYGNKQSAAQQIIGLQEHMGSLQYRIYVRKSLTSNSISRIHCSGYTASTVVVKSFWNTARGTAMILWWPTQNFQIIWQINNPAWAN